MTTEPDNTGGGAPEHVIAKGTIPIRADLAQFEEDKRAIEEGIAKLGESVKATLGAAFKEVFDAVDERIEKVKRAMGELALGEAHGPPPGANPTTGNAPDQVLDRLTEIASTLGRYEELIEELPGAIAIAIK